MYYFRALRPDFNPPEMPTSHSSSLSDSFPPAGAIPLFLSRSRWNLATRHQKLEAFKSKLQFQGELRRQLITRTVAERTALIQEVEAERRAQLIAAEERLHDVQSLKASHAAHLEQVCGLSLPALSLACCCLRTSAKVCGLSIATATCCNMPAMC